MAKITAKTICDMKKRGEKIASITAYDFSSAKYFDEAGADFLLVGDSAAHVVLGLDSTTKISMNEMLVFTSAVARGAKNALVVADMPFLSYQTTVADALQNAGEFIKAGAGAVKIEGASEHSLEVISRLVESGIPVVAHLGFTPQFVNTIGGNFVAGKSFETTLKILHDSLAVERAGAFALVLEMVPKESAEFITRSLQIPTIGIGAGCGCDGQILVSDDVLGRFDGFSPKFSKKYANLKEIMTEAVASYVEDVKGGKFPTDSESFMLKDEERQKLENYKNN